MFATLALGKTMPGPLVIVVVFVGGYQEALLGCAAGAPGAALVAWYTFLPSLFLLLQGGHWPLNAVTAAVVGLIFDLALFFAWHVGWPGEGNGGRCSSPCRRGLALSRFRRGVLPLPGASLFAGLPAQLDPGAI